MKVIKVNVFIFYSCPRAISVELASKPAVQRSEGFRMWSFPCILHGLWASHEDSGGMSSPYRDAVLQNDQ